VTVQKSFYFYIFFTETKNYYHNVTRINLLFLN